MTPPRPRLSLCMIVRDSAATLPACLASIRPWVDEMIVVDTGSRDNTPEIARQFGAKVFHFPWVDSFSAARNESLRLATGEWLFWMDADDVIDERNGRSLRELAYGSHNPRVFGYIVQVHCPDTRSDGDVTAVDHVKLFRNHPAIRFEHRIHEQVLMPIRRLGGEIAWTDVFVVHANADQTVEGRQRKYIRDLRLLELDLQDHPEHPFVLFNFGMTCNDMGKHSEAVRWLERSLAASHPSESQLRKAYALLVHSLAETDQADAAKQVCRKGLELFPRDAELLFRLGMLLHEAGLLQDSARAYRAVLCNGDERHLSSRCQAITGYKARHNLAVVQSELGNDAAAELLWREILDHRPMYRPAWRSLADILVRRQRRASAELLAEQMLLQPQLRGDGLIAQADLARLRGESAWAVKLCGQVRREFSDDLVLHRARCRVLFESQAWPEAELALRELVDRVPSDPIARRNLEVTRQRLNGHNGAVAEPSRSDRLPSVSAPILEIAEGENPDMQTDDDAPLPHCHSRRPLEKTGRFFLCAHPGVHLVNHVATIDICRVCTRWSEPPPSQFRELSPTRFPRTGICQYLGEQTGLRACPTCRGNVQVKVFDCLHPNHESTTVAECSRCKDYSPPPTEREDIVTMRKDS